MVDPKEPLRAVVTGGGSGLGRALCLEIIRRGGEVIIADVDAEGAERTAEEARRDGGVVTTFSCDVADAGQIDALRAAAEERFGEIDLLCNNAGVAVAGQTEEVSVEDWKWIVDINLFGVIHGCRAFLPRMKERGKGHVLNVASAAGLLSPPEMAPYNVTKAGVVALSETLYADNKRHGVKVTVLCPTFFRTRIGESGRGAIDERTRAMIHQLMDRSKIQAEDVARIAVDDVLRGKLYSVPMKDGLAMWRLKRAIGARFYDQLGKMPTFTGEG